MLLDSRSFKEQLELFAKAYTRLNIEAGLDTVRVLFNPENIWFSKDRPMQKDPSEDFSVRYGAGTASKRNRSSFFSQRPFYRIKAY